MTPNDVMALIKDKGIPAIDLRFIDLPGLWQHFTVSAKEFDLDAFEEGVGFDGSSIRGFKQIQESDMLLFPDPATAFEDPFTQHPTLNIICNVKDPITGEAYSRDPRYVAQKAEAYLNSTGIADTAYFGPEPEFFILDDVRFSQSHDHGFYYVDAKEGFWNSGRDEQPNLGYKPRYKEGYFPVPPMDSHQDLRTEMMLELEQVGVAIEVHHHEVGTAGQTEIDMRFDSLVSMGDKLIGGILKHAGALLAFCNPTTNSYRRLVPGYEAPINLIYSFRNRSAAVRIPVYSASEKAKRIEVRFPDPTCNGYLAFSAMLMAGLDGIQNKITPPGPLDKDLYDLPPEEMAKIESTPGSLEESLDALAADNDFLLNGDVFTSDLVETWIDFKRGEVDAIRLRPHPWEFARRGPG